jgi:hypothetical protein
MKMTLASFIDSGGIPAEDTFYLYHPRVFEGMLDCAVKKYMLNRRLECGPAARLLRKLYFDYGIGRIPLHRDVPVSPLLFWGLFDGDVMLSSIHSLFDQLERMSSRKHAVVVGATDDSFTESYARAIPSQIASIFVLNCMVDYPRVNWYPLGRDDKGLEHFGIPPHRDKQIRVYCNFSPATHDSRRKILEMASSMPFVTCIDVDGYGHYTGYPMTNREFLEQLNLHAFCICPRGAGFDTFRLWDSLHLGVIPIMVREEPFHKYLTNLPVLFLDSVDDFAKLSEHFLEEQYDMMLDIEYDFSILTADYWYRRFHDAMQ